MPSPRSNVRPDRRLGALRLAALVALALLTPTSRLGAAPTATYLYPAGGAQGTTVEATVGGEFPHWPPLVWTSDPHVRVTPQEDRGKVRIEIAPEAPLGATWIRFADPTGAAAPRPWIVGKQPEFAEQEPNEAVSQAQTLPLDDAPLRTIVVNGRLQADGDADVFAVPVSVGQTLVADLDAYAELGTPLDGVLQILSPGGHVAAHNDDQRQLDPRLAVDVDQAGTWFVRVFGFPAQPSDAVQLAGREEYVYRLTISAGPVAAAALPLAARRGAPPEFRLEGWNLGPTQVRFAQATPAEGKELRLDDGYLGQTIYVPVVDDEVALEQEPCSLAAPQALAASAVVTGRLDERGDRDAFSVATIAGEQWTFRIESWQLGYPLDPLLRLVDADGKQLAEADDAGEVRDASLTHRVAADGTLRIEVADRFDQGGVDCFYRLWVQRATPDWRLALDVHQATLKPGETIEVPLAIERVAEYGETIEFSLAHLPPGVACTAPPSVAGSDTAAKTTLKLTAAADAQPQSRAVHVRGRSGSSEERVAAFPLVGSSGRLPDLWLTIAPAE